MKFDCIVIGGGIAGLTCGIRCAEAGLSTALVSAGMSALHFSSGSIDLLGYGPDRRVIYDPYPLLPEFIRNNPEHPYARCGVDVIEESLSWFRAQVASQGLELFSNERRNHFHVTALGTLKPTFFSQQSVFNRKIKTAFEKKPKIAILNFQGFRDFHPELGAANLKRHTLFADCDITTGLVTIPGFAGIGRNAFELRSIDICRLMENDDVLDDVAHQIKQVAGDADIVGLPAVIGLGEYARSIQTLRRKTGLIIYETPTLPPSILGMRLDEALKSRFAELGGIFIAGDRAISGDFDGARLDHVHSHNYGARRLIADYFVLSSGSFFSGGLTSEFDEMREPVFGLRLDYTKGRSNWSRREFFHPEGHQFLSRGVRTDDQLRPFDKNGNRIDNLFCAGSILAHYDPLREGSGGGAAISTGFMAARHVISETGRRSNG